MSPKLPDVAVRNVLDAAFDSTGDLERTAGELVATAINRETLEAAHIALVQQMHTGPSDDTAPSTKPNTFSKRATSPT